MFSGNEAHIFGALSAIIFRKFLATGRNFIPLCTGIVIFMIKTMITMVINDNIDGIIKEHVTHFMLCEPAKVAVFMILPIFIHIVSFMKSFQSRIKGSFELSPNKMKCLFVNI